jgi:GxxExxY protein
MTFQPVSEKEDRIAKAIVDSAFAVHPVPGPGLLKSIYETCFCHDLGKKKLSYRRQAPAPILYDGIRFSEGLRLDVLVDETVICELKAVGVRHPVFAAQLLTYLKLPGKRLGFLINFNVPIIKHGSKRIIL